MHTVRISSALVFLFALIIATGLYTHNFLSKTAAKIQDHAVAIEKATKDGNWTNAKAELSMVKKEWSRNEKTWSMLIDHIEIDNIDTALSKMEQYIHTQNTSLVLGEVATLKKFIVHIPDKEAFTLKNIL